MEFAVPELLDGDAGRFERKLHDTNARRKLREVPGQWLGDGHDQIGLGDDDGRAREMRRSKYDAPADFLPCQITLDHLFGAAFRADDDVFECQVLLEAELLRAYGMI